MLKGNDRAVMAENVREMKHKGMSEREAVMVSLKNKHSKKSKEEKLEGPSAPRDDYPYSTRMDMDHEMLEKLGVSELPKHGSPVALHAKGKVHSTSEDTGSDGKKRRRMTVQLTHMKLG
jgi:hypothetical protein